MLSQRYSFILVSLLSFCLSTSGSGQESDLSDAARKEYAEAVELFHKRLRVQEEIGPGEYAPAIRIDLAAAHNRNGDFEEALRLSTRAQELAWPWIQPVWRAHP